MRVAVYDKNPGGGGLAQRLLCFSWKLGCVLHWLLGRLDAYYGASSWEDAFQWLASQPKPLRMVQYWGHGSPGSVWLAQMRVNESDFGKLIPAINCDTVIWFRACSVFQGGAGYAFSKYLVDLLQCTVAGHTRTIGLFQSGLHTRRPNELPSWKVTEGDAGPAWLVGLGLRWGNNTILCLRASIPHGW